VELDRREYGIVVERRRQAVKALVLLAAGALAIQLVRPARTNPRTDSARTLAAAAHVTPEASAVLDRACRDCHSNDTHWPWYSNVAPVSWFVIDHVNSGRRHFNYSDWASHDEDEKPRILKDICELTRKKDMPVESYLWAHSEARVTDTDVAALCAWTDVARQQLRPR
jgi:hypothetical protein